MCDYVTPHIKVQTPLILTGTIGTDMTKADLN